MNIRKADLQELLHHVFIITLFESKAHIGRWTDAEIDATEKKVIDYCLKEHKRITRGVK